MWYKMCGKWWREDASCAVLCRRPRWHLVDYDQMSMPFSLSGLHLRDGIHAGPPFLAQVMNIYLNLHRQHLVESGQKPLPPPSEGASHALLAATSVNRTVTPRASAYNSSVSLD